MDNTYTRVSHHEFHPSPALRPYVDCYWYQTFSGHPSQESPIQRCVPLGMMEIIFHLDENDCFVLADGLWQPLPHAFVVGVYKDAVIWKAKGLGSAFGIRIKPEAIMQLFRIPAATLFNNYMDIDAFFGKNMDALAHKMFGTSQVTTLMQVAEDFLKAQLPSICSNRNYFSEAVNLIRHSKGEVSLEQLSETLFVSERQLQRSFKDSLGMGPKAYLRIIRFRSTYEYLQQAGNDVCWANVSYNFGYADQAHFIRDFKEFTGEVPTSLHHKSEEFPQISGIVQ